MNVDFASLATPKWVSEGLPNIDSIQAILSSLKDNPERWNDLTLIASSADWYAAESIAWYSAHSTGRMSAYMAAFIAVKTVIEMKPKIKYTDFAWAAAVFAIRALVVFDDAGKFLKMTVNEVQKNSLDGNFVATMLLPACNALSKPATV